MVGSVTLACIMKSEEDYLLEWVAHHRLQGVARFVIGDNDDGGEQSRMLAALDRAGIVKRIDLSGVAYAQMGFFRDVLTAAKGSDELVGFIDADEFLMPEDILMPAADILVEVANRTEAGAIGVNWRVYGSSGQTEFRDEPVLERFHGHPPKGFAANAHVKTFALPDRTQQFGPNPHSVILAGGQRYVHADGRELAWAPAGPGLSREVVWDGVALNHYVIKSKGEYTDKKTRRGSAISEQNTEIKKREGYFSHFDRNELSTVIDPSYLTRLKAEMAELRALSERETGA